MDTLTDEEKKALAEQEEAEKQKQEDEKKKSKDVPAKDLKPKVSPKLYQELAAGDIVAIYVEREEIKTDEISDKPISGKDLTVQYVTKSYWESLEKDANGVPRYLRAKLLGLGTPSKGKDGKTTYVSYLPFA